jgi:hypothetical protein
VSDSSKLRTKISISGNIQSKQKQAEHQKHESRPHEGEDKKKYITVIINNNVVRVRTSRSTSNNIIKNIGFEKKGFR